MVSASGGRDDSPGAGQAGWDGCSGVAWTGGLQVLLRTEVDRHFPSSPQVFSAPTPGGCRPASHQGSWDTLLWSSHLPSKDHPCATRNPFKKDWHPSDRAVEGLHLLPPFLEPCDPGTVPRTLRRGRVPSAPLTLSRPFFQIVSESGDEVAQQLEVIHLPDSSPLSLAPGLPPSALCK